MDFFSILKSIKGDIRSKRHSPYFPVTVYEFSGMGTFSGVLATLEILIALLVNFSFGSVLLWFRSENNDMLVALAMSLAGERLTNRYNYLQAYDGISNYYFAVGFFCALTIGVLFGLCMSFRYVYLASQSNKSIHIDRRAICGGSVFVLFWMIVIWVVFFKEIAIDAKPSVGMVGIFVYPLLPVISALTTFGVSSLVFMAIGTAGKIYLVFLR